MPDSRLSHLPVLAGILDPDFTKKTNRGRTGTEIEAIALPGTSGKSGSRLYPKTNKGGDGTELGEKTLAGTSGRPRSRLYQKPIKGHPVPNSMKTHWPVLAGVEDAEFAKNQ